MRTSEHESTERVREIVDSIFDRHLSDAFERIHADLASLDAHYAPSQINAALVAALVKAKAGRS